MILHLSRTLDTLHFGRVGSLGVYPRLPCVPTLQGFPPRPRPAPPQTCRGAVPAVDSTLPVLLKIISGPILRSFTSHVFK